MEVKKFVRRPFQVEAVQVKEDNLAEVAEWCHGDVKHTEDGKPFVKVRVLRPRDLRQTQAFPGDHVLYAANGFKVYTDGAFKKHFEPITDEERPLLTAEGITKID